METIKVNMNPNPLDVQTIHASQGDTEARQWEFELHNNGELIDTSDVTDRITFKSYEGGTEQILPENTSTPTTSPFKGDIKYPQGLLADQEFTYRQSPTEEDGLAKITDIKGNTLVWNQQIDSSQYLTGTYQNVAVTISTDGTYLIANGTASANAYIKLLSIASIPTISGHKYLCIVPTDSDVTYYDDSTTRQYNLQSSSFVFTSNGNSISPYARITSGIVSTNRRISFMMFDLTQMGLDISSPSEFTSLFPLSYYAYNQGTLLSFMGNGIKTVSEDESEESTLSLPISTFFPNGMKSAGSVYDELTETKAITRIGSVDLGSLTWSYRESGTSLAPYFYATFMGVKYVNPNFGIANVLCAKYQTVRRTTSTFIDKTICMDGDSTRLTQLQIKDSSFTDATALKNSLQGQYLYYEMVTETETSFTTASLVTENAEIPLSNDDGVLIGKCTEQLSSESGFFDAKIKLADEDGECYSNKVQLHIERSPQ